MIRKCNAIYFLRLIEMMACFPCLRDKHQSFDTQLPFEILILKQIQSIIRIDDT